MPLNPDIKKVMVIGSGPIVIGQAAEFDYAGTQACTCLLYTSGGLRARIIHNHQPVQVDVGR